MKKSTIPALCFFAVIVLVAHWPRPLTFTVRVQTPGVPPLDLATTDFLAELNRLGLQRAPNDENFAAGLVEFIDIPDLTGPARKATLSAYGIEDTKAAQSVSFFDFISAKYRFAKSTSPFGYRRRFDYFPLRIRERLFGPLTVKPWTRRRFPDVSEWLDAKHGLLDDIEQISHRPHYFQYLLSEDGTVLAAKLPLVSPVRNLCWLYSARANRALGEGNLAEAQKDILTQLRISALLFDGDFGVEVFTGGAINAEACRLATQWLSHPDLTSSALNEFASRLDGLSHLAIPVRPVDLAERFVMFQQIATSHRRGFSENHHRLFPNAVLCSLADWNDIARRSAQEADEFVEILKLEDPESRRTRLGEQSLSSAGARFELMVKAVKDPAWTLARGEAGVFVGQMFSQYKGSYEHASMRRQVVEVFAALKRYQLEHGEFPDKPGEALGKQSGTLPTDVHSNRPMRYLKTGNGVVLYSVGRSRTDNGGWNGQGRDDLVWVLGTDDRQDPLEKTSEQDTVLARLKRLGVHLHSPKRSSSSRYTRETKKPPIYFDGTVTDEQVARFVEMEQEWAPLSTTGWTLWFLGSQITDASLDRLSQLDGISALLFFDTDITEAGLSRIKDFRGLTMLYLGQPKVTDMGLANLKGATQLRVLNVRGTLITAAGLEHLKGLQLTTLLIPDRIKTDLGLRYLAAFMPERVALSLVDWEITDAGLVHLKELTNLQHLDLGATKITDAGLVHLKGLTVLRTLDLASTRITDAGLVHLTGLGELRNLSVSGLPISDHGLVHLKRLTNLNSLTLRDTQITDPGVADLKKSLPNCKITK